MQFTKIDGLMRARARARRVRIGVQWPGQEILGAPPARQASRRSAQLIGRRLRPGRCMPFSDMFGDSGDDEADEQCGEENDRNDQDDGGWSRRTP
jgi:hypothetical protein